MTSDKTTEIPRDWQQRRVGDVMTTEVVPVSVNQTMAEAARLMADRSLTAAPIVDEYGHCVGMLAGSDFMRKQTVGDDEPTLAGKQHELVQEPGSEAFHIAEAQTDLVGSYMAPGVQCVEPTATLAEAARIMCAQRVHQLPVLDAHSHPVGIVTSLDILAAALAG